MATNGYTPGNENDYSTGLYDGCIHKLLLYKSHVLSFDVDEVRGWIEQAIDPVLGKATYHSKKVHDWSSSIVESVLKSLQQANKPFKYVVTCIIMQKNGAGLHTASTCYWDTKTDGSCSVRWDNQTMHAIVTVFALHI